VKDHILSAVVAARAEEVAVVIRVPVTFVTPLIVVAVGQLVGFGKRASDSWL